MKHEYNPLATLQAFAAHGVVDAASFVMQNEMPFEPGRIDACYIEGVEGQSFHASPPYGECTTITISPKYGDVQLAGCFPPDMDRGTGDLVVDGVSWRSWAAVPWLVWICELYGVKTAREVADAVGLREARGGRALTPSGYVYDPGDTGASTPTYPPAWRYDADADQWWVADDLLASYVLVMTVAGFRIDPIAREIADRYFDAIKEHDKHHEEKIEELIKARRTNYERRE